MSETTGRSVAALTDDERKALHDGVCPNHRDIVPGVYVCGPCERAGDAAVERILAQRADVDHAKIEAVRAIAQDLGSAYTMDQWDEACIRLRAALDDATTTRPPPCPSRWADNRGVHCRLRDHDPKLVDHTNGVVSWSEAEAAG